LIILIICVLPYPLYSIVHWSPHHLLQIASLNNHLTNQLMLVTVLSVCISILSACLCLSIYPSVTLSIHSSIHPSTYLSVYFCLSPLWTLAAFSVS
jgi:hypothetical protein